MLSYDVHWAHLMYGFRSVQTQGGLVCCWSPQALNSSYYLWYQWSADPCLSDSPVTMASRLSDDNSNLRWEALHRGPHTLVIKLLRGEKRALTGSSKIRALIEMHGIAVCWTLCYKPGYNGFVLSVRQRQNCLRSCACRVFVFCFSSE